MLTADETFSLDARIAPPVDKRQRNFWIALGFALAAHAAFLVQINSSREHEARRTGSETGADNAISVEIVTEKDLQSLSSVSLQSGGAPPMKPSVQPQEAQPEQAPPPPPEAPPTPEPQPAPEPPTKSAEPAPPEPKPAEPTVTAEAKPEPTETKPPPAPAFEALNPDLSDTPLPSESKEPSPPEAKKAEPVEKETPPKPVEKQVQPEPAPKQVKPETAEKAVKPQPPAKKKQAKLDFAPPPVPPGVSSGPPGRSTAATRPPGITRSGENDRFGIAAIRALAQTFPMLRDTYGRVTVRLLLNENGDLVDVKVVSPSGKPLLDQSVVFSTKQASFPLPPRGSTQIDRTFIVTYVYR